MKSLIACMVLTAATAAGAQDKLTVYTNGRYDDKATTLCGAIYDSPKLTLALEEQSTGKDVKKGAAAKLTEGPFSVQFDTDFDGDGQIKLIAKQKGFSFIAGGSFDKDKLAFGGVTYEHKPMQEKNNFGFGATATNFGMEAGLYGFGRFESVFAGFNRTPTENKFILSYPSDCKQTPKGVNTPCPAARWSGVRRKGFSYDQLNFTLDSEMQGGLDSLRALQDLITSPEESIATATNPLRFVCRPDQRGYLFNVQLGRTIQGEKTSYAAEADAYVSERFWLGGNYDNSNGNTYGIAVGSTEHPRRGPGRVPFSIRGDVKYNIDRKNVSVGLHVAKRFTW